MINELDCRAENAALRQIISDCAKALGNGCVIHPTCSVEFMGYLPNEIRLHVEKLRRPASADTHPKDGDVKQAPLVSGAVPRGDEADAQ